MPNVLVIRASLYDLIEEKMAQMAPLPTNMHLLRELRATMTEVDLEPSVVVVYTDRARGYTTTLDKELSHIKKIEE